MLYYRLVHQENPTLRVLIPLMSLFQVNASTFVKLFHLFNFHTDKIHNHTVKWEGIDFGDGSSIGTNFVFDKDQSKLTVKRGGSYFIYLNLSFRIIDLNHSTNGKVKVTLKSSKRKLLTCEVKLTQGNMQEKCWAVAQHLQEGSDITADMDVHGSLSGWKLVSNESGFGMFLVDSPSIS